MLRRHVAQYAFARCLPFQRRTPAIGSRAAASHSAIAPISPTAFREADDQVPLTERQEGILLERIPPTWTEERIKDSLKGVGIELGDDWQNQIMLMRSRLGKSLGRAVVAVTTHVPQATALFPPGTTYKPVDKNDIMSFVEQCERFVRLSDDLRRLAEPENFLRTITITEVPSNYGRTDIVYILQHYCGVVVPPQDVVFRFKRWGRQSDTCYVICPTEQEANHCVTQIQELAVPKRAAYGSLFGAAFLWSSRGTLFLSHPDLDFLIHDDNAWVFTTGWEEDMTEDEFVALMTKMGFYPTKVKRHHIAADASSAFFMRFRNIDQAKLKMKQLRRLRHRWRIKPQTPFFAYPRRIDIHRADEEKYEDEDSGGDSDLDEHPHY